MPSRALILLSALAALAVLAPPPAAAAAVRVVARDLPLDGPERALASDARLLPEQRAPLVFDLVGLHWRGPGRVWFRTRPAGGSFGPWLEAAPEAEDLPDPGSREASGPAGWRLGNPYWTGRARLIQYRTEGRVTALRAFFVWSAPGPLPRRLAAAATPEIIPRSAWGADESIVRAAPSYAQAVRFAVVHHTAGANDYGPEDSAAIVRGIQAYHVKANGWNDIGYNFLVDRYGQIFEGRAGGIDRNVVGAHALGFNTGSVGAAVIGTYGDEPIPATAEAALEGLLAWRLDVAHVDPLSLVEVKSGGNSLFPAGTPVVLRAVSGHRDTGPTECPGEALYAQLDAAAAAAAAIGLPKLYAPAAEPARLVTDASGKYLPVRLTARLSEPLPWRVDVTAAGGAPVAEATGEGATVDWTWPATSADGSPVDPTGTYVATISAPGVLPARIVLAGRSPAAPLDVVGLSVTPSSLSPDGDGTADEARIAFALTAGARVSVRLEDEAGTKVATILPRRSLAAGTAEIVWNGARRDGGAIPDGVYRVTVEALRDGATVTRTATVVLDRTLARTRVSPRRFSPNGDGRLDELAVSFALARPATVRVVVRRGSHEVATVFAGELAAGAQTITWDGLSERRPAPDGRYAVVVEATSQLGTMSRRGRFVLDTTRPVVSLLAVSSRRGATRVAIALSEPARVKVWTRAGAVALGRRHGRTAFSVPGRPKRVRLVAWDAAGNASETVRVSVGS